MSKYSVKKPITVLMGVLILVVLGAFSLTRLPLTLFPDLELPYVVTITDYQGASPEVVEKEVAKKIEASVATIGNFSEISSMSNEHFGISMITFSEGSNMDSIVVEMRELLNNISFPSGVGSTRILRISPDMLPVVTLTLFKDYEADLTDDEILILNTQWLNETVLQELQSIPGVADVSITGNADVVLEINLDQTKLAAVSLTHDQVLQTIENQNISGLVGVALDNGQLRMLYLGNEIASLDEIKALPITFFNNEVIYLEDLSIEGGIKYVNANTDTYSKINLQQGIQVSFTKQSNVAITDVSKAILARMDELVKEDSSAHYEVILDQGEYINLSIGSVLQNLIIGGLLAIVILFMFLKDIKPTLIVGLAIPISVITSFMLMYFAGVSLNLISMGGLALAIGMLVDNAVVVIENIYRMISIGKSKTEAAIEGAKQVAGAITASTITTVAVFLPIVFIEGMIADIFMSMALTIAFSLGASLFIALTVVPSMASRLLNDQKPQKEGKWIKGLKQAYEKAVSFTLKRKVLTLVSVVVLLVLSTFLVARKGLILIPESDEGVVSISVVTSSSTSFSDKATYTDELTELLLSTFGKDIESVSASIGASGGMNLMAMSTSSDISISVSLDENRSKNTKTLEKEIRALVSEFKYDHLSSFNLIESTVSSQNSTGALLGSSGINIKVSGYDLYTLEQITNDLVSILNDSEGITKADNGISVGENNVKVTVIKEEAIKHNLTVKDFNESISNLFVGLDALGASNEATVTLDGIIYDINLPNDSLQAGISLEAFGSYQDFLSGVYVFDSSTQALIDQYVANNGSIYTIMPSGFEVIEGQVVPILPLRLVVDSSLKVDGGMIVKDTDPLSTLVSLSSLGVSLFETTNPIADVSYVTGFSVINTDGSQRYFNVTAQIEEGYNVTLVSSEVNQKINSYLNSDEFKAYGMGYRVEIAGESEEIVSAISDLGLALVVAILLVYMVMAIQFQSLVYPFIILMTIPLAFTGGMIGLFVTGGYLSLVSMMGLIILVGVVVNNGIVLIDYINKLREDGMGVIEAIIEAGKTRLRPIFMTSLTTILGLGAMAIGIGEGSELLQPMAITAIGGLLYSTILTLLVIPVVYALFNRKNIKKEAIQDDSDQR